MLKLEQNPPPLYPAVGSIHELTHQWSVAHTKARNEKALAWDLLRQGVSYYLPMIRRTLFSGGRRRKSLVPLFSSYVFLNGDEQARYRALLTNRVCNVIAIDDQPRFITELSAIERVLSSGASIDPVPFAAVGKLVRVARGPFRGLIGRVVRRDNITRLVMTVSILSRGAEMDIDADVLEAME